MGSKLSRADILKLAQLSQLELSDQEVTQFEAEISTILDYVQQLQEADLDGVEPTYQVTGLKDVTRPDQERSYGPSAQDLLKNAPELKANQFKVKRVVN